MEQKIGVLGAGSWGTALAVTLAKKGHGVRLWDIDGKHLAELAENRENRRYLPEVPFPEGIEIAGEPEAAIAGRDLILFSVPAQHFRSAFSSALPYLKPEQAVVNVAKGIEQKSLSRMSEIAWELWPQVKYAVLSGPSHAEEVGRFLPTTVVAASHDEGLARYVQDVFMTERLRVYTNGDVTGVELAGALKNIIALGAGISDGMGFGDNAKAALMTRGIAEITRLGVRLGAAPSTFSGLAGIGDLIVTCTSMHSRNRRCGIMIGQGMKPEEAVEKVGMVVEGYYTTEAAYALAERAKVEMPITAEIYKLLKGFGDAESAVAALMGRERKGEAEAYS
ncbi:MAG: NAD(P)H-dependent glycerol-3-phosphate dehydrogenase [Bacillota bacterium]|nr:NAD(P)H-dependent glycerol-3-phosphate dehydrogenase [Bacillota bacterium]